LTGFRSKGSKEKRKTRDQQRDKRIVRVLSTVNDKRKGGEFCENERRENAWS